MIQDLKLGWKEFTSHTWLWVIVMQFSLVVAALEGIFGLSGPAAAREQMSGAVDWGFIAASFGVGMIIGGIVALNLRVKYPMRFGTLCVFFFSGIPITLSVPLPVTMVAVTG